MPLVAQAPLPVRSCLNRKRGNSEGPGQAPALQNWCGQLSRIRCDRTLAFGLENRDPERWQGHLDMAGLTLPGHRHRLPAGRVGNAAAAIFRIVSIDDLAIETRFRHADAVAIVRDRGEVADHHQVIV